MFLINPNLFFFVKKKKKSKRKIEKHFTPVLRFPNDTKMSSDRLLQDLCAAVDTLDHGILIERHGQWAGVGRSALLHQFNLLLCVACSQHVLIFGPSL